MNAVRSKYGISAEARLGGGEFIVASRATERREPRYRHTSYDKLHAELKSNGVLGEG